MPASGSRDRPIADPPQGMMPLVFITKEDLWSDVGFYLARQTAHPAMWGLYPGRLLTKGCGAGVPAYHQKHKNTLFQSDADYY